MQRLITENQEILEEIKDLEAKLLEVQAGSSKQTNVIKVKNNKKGAGKKGKGYSVGAGKVKTFKKTKELFNTFLSGEDDAIQQGEKLLEKLKKQRNKYNLNSQDALGETILMKACRKGDVQLVEWLIKNGAQINHQDLEGETALMVASKLDAYDICQVLLDKLAEKKQLKKGIDLVLKQSRKTALMQASELGLSRVASLLLEYGANPEKKDLDGKTAKELAKGNKHKKVAKALGSAGKSKPAEADEEEYGEDAEDFVDDVLSDDSSEYSDLDDESKPIDGYLMNYDDDDSMAELLERNRKLKKKKERLIMEIAAAEQKRAPDEWDQIRNLDKKAREQLLMNDTRPEKIKSLIKEFHDLVVADKWEKFESKFLTIKNPKITIDVKDSFGETALMKAARQGNVDSCEMLITYRAKVDVRDNNGDTALMIAALHNKVECARVLIDAGANLNHHTKHKRHTALMHASIRGHEPMVNLLIERQANITLSDANGQLAKDLCPFDDVREILEAAEAKVKATRYSTDPTILT